MSPQQPWNGSGATTVAFVQFGYRTENAVFIGSLADLLRARGATGLLITDDSSAAGHESDALRVVVTPSSPPNPSFAPPVTTAAAERAAGRPSAAKVGAHRLKKDLRKLRQLFRNMRGAYNALARHGDVKSIVGIESQGGMAAGLLAIWLRKPFYYCSMELQSADVSSRPVDRLLGAVLRRLVRRAVLVTVQDRDRATVLQERLRVRPESIALLPVGTTAPPKHAKTQYLHRTLGIDATRKIVLYAGSIREWACVEEIAVAAKSWPSDYCLVIHGFVASDTDDYLRAVRRHVDNRTVYLSTRPVTWAELDDLLCSAYIAIAGYSSIEMNTALISSSSNKLVNYARCGLPVVITYSESVDRMFDAVAWGVAFKDWASTGQALMTIDHDYETYRRRAFEAFDRFYDLNVLGRQFAGAIAGGLPTAHPR